MQTFEELPIGAYFAMPHEGETVWEKTHKFTVPHVGEANAVDPTSSDSIRVGGHRHVQRLKYEPPKGIRLDCEILPEGTTAEVWDIVTHYGTYMTGFDFLGAFKEWWSKSLYDTLAYVVKNLAAPRGDPHVEKWYEQVLAFDGLIARATAAPFQGEIPERFAVWRDWPNLREALALKLLLDSKEELPITNSVDPGEWDIRKARQILEVWPNRERYPL